jgi:hypothetical protein
MAEEPEKKTSFVLFKTPSWGILGTAFLVMLAAKCFGYATDLSWWIVTFPLWGPWALTIAFFVGFYALAFIGVAIVGIIGLVLGIIFAIYDFFKKLFTRNNDDDNEYRLHS